MSHLQHELSELRTMIEDFQREYAELTETNKRVYDWVVDAHMMLVRLYNGEPVNAMEIFAIISRNPFAKN